MFTNRRWMRIAAVLLAAAFLRSGAAEGSTPADSGPTVHESAWSGTITAGYESRYVLYGYRLSRHLFHLDLFVYRPAAEKVSWWAGAWAGALSDGTYREADFYAGMDVALTERLSVGLGYSLFGYFKVPFSDRTFVSEWAAQAVYSLGDLVLTVRDQYDIEAEGHLVRLLAGYVHPLAGPVSVRGEAEFGYAFGYYIEGHRAHHARFTLAVPLGVSSTIVVEPFLAQSLALGAIEAVEEDEVWGGVTVQWAW